MKILACGAHPDDVDLACGATLALAVQQGHEVAILDLTRGELGSNGDPRSRAEEASKSAELLGVRARYQAGLLDGHLNAGHEIQCKIVVEWLRRIRPDLLIIPARENRHPDHDQANKLMRRASFLAGLARNETEGDPFRPRVVIEVLERRLARPDFIMDVSRVHAKKVEALRAFRSQFQRLPDSEETLINRPGFLEAIRSRDRYYGELSGCEWGEPFRTTDLLRIVRISSLLPEGEVPDA